MTIPSEFKLRFVFDNLRVYSCTLCDSLVAHNDRRGHRQKMHPPKVTIVNAPEVEENTFHVFDPGGRAHWAMPRCAVRWCREMADHPNHIQETPK